MLSRSQRLNSHEFAVAFEKGRVLRHPLLQLRVYRRESGTLPQDGMLRESEAFQSDGHETGAPKTGNHVARAAFVVPKKLGKATWRNRVRRRVRERYRLLGLRKEGEDQSQSSEYGNNELQDCDLIFFINAQSEAATVAQIDEALVQLMKRAQKAVNP